MRRLLLVLCCVLLVAASVGCKKKKKGKGKELAEILVPSKRTAPDFVNIEVDSGGFSPKKITAVTGKPITLIFTRTTDKTCATKVVFPSENRTEVLPLDKPVKVLFLPGKPGTVRFACPTNEVSGEIDVGQ